MEEGARSPLFSQVPDDLILIKNDEEGNGEQLETNQTISIIQAKKDVVPVKNLQDAATQYEITIKPKSTAVQTNIPEQNQSEVTNLSNRLKIKARTAISHEDTYYNLMHEEKEPFVLYGKGNTNPIIPQFKYFTHNVRSPNKVM